jgi:hypothetical protein
MSKKRGRAQRVSGEKLVPQNGTTSLEDAIAAIPRPKPKKVRR